MRSTRIWDSLSVQINLFSFLLHEGTNLSGNQTSSNIEEPHTEHEGLSPKNDSTLLTTSCHYYDLLILTTSHNDVLSLATAYLFGSKSLHCLKKKRRLQGNAAMPTRVKVCVTPTAPNAFAWGDAVVLYGLTDKRVDPCITSTQRLEACGDGENTYYIRFTCLPRLIKLIHLFKLHTLPTYHT